MPKDLQFREAIKNAISLLDPKGRDGVKYNKIAEQMLSTPQFAGENLDKFKDKVLGCLNRDVKGKTSIFEKVPSGRRNPKTGKVSYRAGVYRIKTVPKPKPPIDVRGVRDRELPSQQTNLFGEKERPKKSLKPTDPKPTPYPYDKNASSSQIGKAGEYAVMSELLYRGYHVCPMAVDDGVDVVAFKDKKIFFIQVKTTGLEGGTFKFNVARESFDRYAQNDMFYVFVLRYVDVSGKLVNQFLVFPYLIFHDFMESDLTSENGKVIDFKFVLRDNICIEKGLASRPVPAGYVNGFDYIK